MKNEVLLRYKRARWHSVIGDSSIYRAAGACSVIADLIRNPEGRRRVAVMLASRQYPQGGVMGLSCFTLTFDSSPIKGEGILLVVLDLFTRAPAAPLDCGSSPQ